MSHPFAQSPRLKDYLEFLSTQGCTWKVRGAVGRSGRTYRELVITNGSGQHYIIVMPDPEDRIGLSQMENIKRRLGITEPYLPPQSPDDGDA